MAAESKLESKLREQAEARGFLLLKLAIIGKRGFPDRTLLVPGRPPIFVELKAPGGSVKPWQARWHKRLRDLGHQVEVVWTLEQGITLLEAQL